MATLLFTGFPGFLGKELLPRVLARRSDAEALCVVQEKFLAQAHGVRETLERARAHTAGRIRLVTGDITAPGLGLGAGELPDDVVEIHHLAAIYDLGVPRAIALRVNVDGTRNVLDVAERCPSLERLHYVSTCYVSGRHPGVFREEDLEVGQTFNNHYEETKYLAEREVRARMKSGLRATIYRPAITVGDAATGITQKYDGPYYAIQWLVRQPWRVALMPVVGDLSAEVNVVPRDFVVDAIAHLAGHPASSGKTYQLADPAPLTAGEMLDVLAAAIGKRMVHVPLGVRTAKFAIEKVPGVHRLLRIPSPMIDYFVHPTRYDTRNASADLAGSGIACPPFPSYVERLIGFVRAHPEIGAEAMA